MRIKVSRELVDLARNLANDIHNEKRFNKDKFLTGTEKEADFLGFFLEFAVCFHFGIPFPELIEGTQVDEFDVKLKEMRFDVKNSKRCLINLDQFERKKGHIDAFLFGTEQLFDYGEGFLYADLFGWIKYEDVPSHSKIVEFSNGSKAYQVSKRSLKKIEELE